MERGGVEAWVEGARLGAVCLGSGAVERVQALRGWAVRVGCCSRAGGGVAGVEGLGRELVVA